MRKEKATKRIQAFKELLGTPGMNAQPLTWEWALPPNPQACVDMVNLPTPTPG